MYNQAKNILKDVFGYDEFRPYQFEIIKSVLNRRDTLAIIPTGGGKSICYQIPALIFKGLSVVISPLISLMKDQTDQLKELGVPSVVLNSSLSNSEYNNNERKILQGKVKILYLAPEALLKERMINLLSKTNIEFITVDEAHCISEWGHDFRPEYRRIVELRDIFKDVSILALTATATEKVRKDIIKNLAFKNSSEFVASFNRENLFLDVVPKSAPNTQVLEFLEKFPNQSGIIYCFSRALVDDLSVFLENQGYSVKPYHAGLDEKTRKLNQELFIRDDVKIIVATIAFGMGINKPNIRFVIHYNLPKSIESYYQEIGRAGRDGLKAHCLLLFGYDDIGKIQYFIDKKEEAQERRNARMHLDALLQFAEFDGCKRKPLLNYFGEEYEEDNCGMCTNCISDDIELIDITTEAKKFLSCVKRTGEIFGAGHIIDVLRGSESVKVLNNNHHHLSTYGIGKEYSKKQWFHLSRQFLQKGLMNKTPEYGSIKITASGWEVLKGKQIVMGRLQEVKTDYSKAKETDIQYDKILFNKLRNIRKALADRFSIPPYAIFPDKTLMEMAAYFPQSENSLLNIYGVGKVKFIKYGNYFLNVIKNYSIENDKNELIINKRHSNKIKDYSLKKYKHQIIGEEFNNGLSISELSEKFDVLERTIIQHLYKYLLDGYSLNQDFLDEEIDFKIENQLYEAFEEVGVMALRPIYDKFDGKYSYDEISIMRLFYINKNPESLNTGTID